MIARLRAWLRDNLRLIPQGAGDRVHCALCDAPDGIDFVVEDIVTAPRLWIRITERLGSPAKVRGFHAACLASITFVLDKPYSGAWAVIDQRMKDASA